MKHKNESKQNNDLYAKVNNVYYEHSIEVSKSIISKIELFIFAIFVHSFYRFFENGLTLTDTVSKISFSICLLIIVRLIWKFFWGVKRETILIIKSLGLQITTTYHSNFNSSTFIPWHSVDDVIINEAVLMQRVIYYLAVLVNSTDKSGITEQLIIPFFLHSQPRLDDLKKIYRNIQSILNK